MKFGVPTTLKEAAKKKKIIPVLGGGHLDGFQAKLPPSKDSTWWSAQLFPEMVAVVHNQEQQFAQRLDVAKFSSTELLSRILDNDHLTVEERARAIVGFIKCKDKPNSEKICCLLCDESETSLPPDTKSMLQSTGELPSLPSWATIRFLHRRLRQQLADLLQTADNHDLQHQLRAFGVSEYSFETVVNSVISESDIQVRSQPDNESAIRQETIKFLWVIHHGAGRNTAFPPDTTVKLPNQLGGWTDSKQLYLGEGYGSEGKVLQNIYSWAKYKLVANIDNLGLDLSIEIELVKRFLLWLGVACWPREIELKNYESEYLDDLIWK
jgi:hypothetical protein